MSAATGEIIRDAGGARGARAGLVGAVAPRPRRRRPSSRRPGSSRGGGISARASCTTAAAWRDGRLVGLAPFYLEDGALGRRLLPLGISLSDYLDVLLDDGESEAAGALVAALGREPAWDSLECEELAPDAAALSLPAPAGCVETIVAQSACPVLVLPGAAISPSSFQVRPAASSTWPGTGRHGAAVAASSASGRGPPRRLRRACAAARAALAGARRPGVLADARVAAFHRDALPRLDARRPAAPLPPALRRRGRQPASTASRIAAAAYSYLTGFDPAFAFESPGALLLAHAVEEAIAEGAGEFHFLRGREAYKYEWGARRPLEPAPLLPPRRRRALGCLTRTRPGVPASRRASRARWRSRRRASCPRTSP